MVIDNILVLVSCKERSLQQCGCWMLYRRCIGCKGWSTSGSFWLCRFCCLQCCYRLLHEELNDPTTTSIADSCDTYYNISISNGTSHTSHTCRAYYTSIAIYTTPYIDLFHLDAPFSHQHPLFNSLYCKKRPCIIYLYSSKMK